MTIVDLIAQKAKITPKEARLLYARLTGGIWPAAHKIEVWKKGTVRLEEALPVLNFLEIDTSAIKELITKLNS